MPTSSQVAPRAHVIVIPFPLHSHPYTVANLTLKLARASPNTRFSFLNTAKSNQTLFSTSNNPNDASLKSLPNVKVYDVDDGLPAELRGKPPTMRSVEVDYLLKSAPTNYEAAIRLAEEEVGIKVSCLFSDAFMLFVCELAKARNVKWVVFWNMLPHALSAFIYMDRITELRREKRAVSGREEAISLSVLPGLSMMHIEDLPERVVWEHDGSQISTMFRSLSHAVPRAAAVVMNLHEEVLDIELIDDLKAKFKTLLLAGCQTVSYEPLPPIAAEDDETGCLSWLNEQRPKTVAYLSFGSIAMPSPPEIRVMAEALEETQTPFLWSVKENFQVHFPQGFLERARHHGKVVPWAPQRRVLAHPACGVHVTHCGLNSLFESVAGGVPMLGWPIWADNMMIARLMEEVWRIGLRLGGEDSCKAITKEGMKKCLSMVLSGEEGIKLRERVGKLRDTAAEASGENGSVQMDIRTLVEIVSSTEQLSKFI